jgi:plastocyanin
MKFVERCPKCRGEVQTKSVKKSIGLGFVDIPTAQFCLNPQCDWYQDFSETKKPDEIKEDVLQIKLPSIKDKIPELKKPPTSAEITQKSFSRKGNLRNVIVLGGVIVFIVILSYYLIPQFTHPQNTPNINVSVTTTPAADTTQGPVLVQGPAPVITPRQSVSYPVKMDVEHGFNPAVISINRSDTIVWSNEEQQRTRIVFVSKEGLFENKTTEYAKKIFYQFNQSGTYNFILTESPPSLKEYPNAIGKVIVK